MRSFANSAYSWSACFFSPAVLERGRNSSSSLSSSSSSSESLPASSDSSSSLLPSFVLVAFFFFSGFFFASFFFGASSSSSSATAVLNCFLSFACSCGYVSSSSSSSLSFSLSSCPSSSDSDSGAGGALRFPEDFADEVDARAAGFAALGRCCFGEVFELASDPMSRAENANGVVGFDRSPLSGVWACAGASIMRGSRAEAPASELSVKMHASTTLDMLA
mmetsp:Transcript_5395/g.11972  ORF Transcript_5395/g.11972 Transcript_5395/m.11972 type:complete len:220 (-) Transcript_5395:3340-3999(-)